MNGSLKWSSSSFFQIPFFFRFRFLLILRLKQRRGRIDRFSLLFLGGSRFCTFSFFFRMISFSIVCSENINELTHLNLWMRVFEQPADLPQLIQKVLVDYEPYFRKLGS